MVQYYYAAMAGIQIVNSVVKANNTKKAAERQNETIRAKQAWLEQEKIHSKKIYELSTLSRYFENFAAGSRRIAQVGFSGASKSASSAALSQFDDMLLRRDMSVSDLRIQNDFGRINNEIKTLEGQMQDPSGEAWAAFIPGLVGATQTGVKGYEAYQQSKDMKTQEAVTK